MRRGLGIVGAAFVVALALAPRIADAQQIFACVSNANGAIKIVAPDATCSKNEHKIAWGGALAGADFNCAIHLLTNGQPLTFTYSHSNFGTVFGSASAIIPNPVTGFPQEFDSFLLQQGIYQIHLSGSNFGITNPDLGILITAILDPQLAVNQPSWDLRGADIIGGDRLVTIGPNTKLTFTADGSDIIRQSGLCELIIIKLQ